MLSRAHRWLQSQEQFVASAEVRDEFFPGGQADLGEVSVGVLAKDLERPPDGKTSDFFTWKTSNNIQ